MKILSLKDLHYKESDYLKKINNGFKKKIKFNKSSKKDII